MSILTDVKGDKEGRQHIHYEVAPSVGHSQSNPSLRSSPNPADTQEPTSTSSRSRHPESSRAAVNGGDFDDEDRREREQEREREREYERVQEGVDERGIPPPSVHDPYVSEQKLLADRAYRRSIRQDRSIGGHANTLNEKALSKTREESEEDQGNQSARMRDRLDRVLEMQAEIFDIHDRMDTSVDDVDVTNDDVDVDAAPGYDLSAVASEADHSSGEAGHGNSKTQARKKAEVEADGKKREKEEEQATALLDAMKEEDDRMDLIVGKLAKLSDAMHDFHSIPLPKLRFPSANSQTKSTTKGTPTTTVATNPPRVGSSSLHRSDQQPLSRASTSQYQHQPPPETRTNERDAHVGHFVPAFPSRLPALLVHNSSETVSPAQSDHRAHHASMLTPSVSGQTQTGTQTAPSTSGADTESSGPAHSQPQENALDTSVLKDLAKTALVESLNEIQGAKTLVIDPSLAGPLGLITEVSLLKHQAVEKMFWLEPGPLSAPTRHIVWLCRPKRAFMKIIADQIKSHQTHPPASSSASGPHHYTILFVPRATELCKTVLEEEGIAGDVDIGEYKLEFIPLENDVLSLELENVSRDLFLDGDDTPTYYASTALMTLQRAFGLFPRIIGKGNAAKRLADLLKRHRQSSHGTYGDLELSDQVDGLIILDRSVDWVTPMCTQLTYEGLLSEYIGIKNSHIEVDPTLSSSSEKQGAQSQSQPQPQPQAQTSISAAFSQSMAPTKKKKQLLSSQTDRLFSEIRDLNFSAVGTRLSKTARRLEENYEGRHNLKTVKEMKEFVGKIGGLQSEQQGLRLHTGLSEILMPITSSDEFGKALEIQQNLLAGYDTSNQLSSIEDLMYQQIPYTTVLRLLILFSITSGGIRQKSLESLEREFLQVYGYHHLPLLIALKRLNLLVKAPVQNNLFPQLRKALRLVVDDIDDQKPDDIAYTYSGYAPLSIRLVQCITQKPAVAGGAGDRSKLQLPIPKAHPIAGWKGFEDVIQAIPGATFDEVQKPDNETSIPQSGTKSADGTKTTIVFFNGGCTHTEISALRWLNSQTKGRRYLIATTNIINGKDLISNFGYPTPLPLKR